MSAARTFWWAASTSSALRVRSGCAGEETAGEGLAVGGELLAGGIAEDVEALEGNEQWLAEFLQDVFDVGVGQVGGGGDGVAA